MSDALSPLHHVLIPTCATVFALHGALQGLPVGVQALYQTERIHRIVEIALDALRCGQMLRSNLIDFSAGNKFMKFSLAC